MKFQAIVIIILGILFIITLIAFYYIATARGNNMPFPPSIPICPDYYYQTALTPDGTVSCKAMPNMVRTLRRSDVNSNECLNPTFSSEYYTGTNANCLKYNWSQNCNSIPAWEGITYGVHNPCATK
jgi:hypothetical protein